MSQSFRVPACRAVTLIKLVVALTMATILPLKPGSAASLTNRDAREHTLTIDNGKDESKRVLKPNEALNDVCREGCVVRLSDKDSDAYELEGTDVVVIEDGFIYYAGPEGSALPATPPQSAPQPVK